MLRVIVSACLVATARASTCSDLKVAFMSGETSCCDDMSEPREYELHQYRTAQHLLLGYETNDSPSTAANGRATAAGLRAAFSLFGDIMDQRNRTFTMTLEICESAQKVEDGLQCVYDRQGYVSVSAYSTTTASSLSTYQQLGVNNVFAGYGPSNYQTSPVANMFTMGPTYNNAAAKWISTLPKNLTVGYVGYGGGYGDAGEAAVAGYEGTMLIYRCNSTTKCDRFEMDTLLDDWKAQGVEALYTHPWSSMTENLLSSASERNMLSMVTTVWWGMSFDTSPKHIGVKAIAMATSVLPVAVPAGMSPSVFANAFRDGVLVTEAARQYILANQNAFSYEYKKTNAPSKWYYYNISLTSNMMSTALNTVQVTAERLTELGLADFMAPCLMTPTDHSGCGGTAVVEWSGASWVPVGV
jgi:hypothetical protein